MKTIPSQCGGGQKKGFGGLDGHLGVQEVELSGARVQQRVEIAVIAEFGPQNVKYMGLWFIQNTLKVSSKMSRAIFTSLRRPNKEVRVIFRAKAAPKGKIPLATNQKKRATADDGVDT
jgi:hypothetical protein